MKNKRKQSVRRLWEACKGDERLISRELKGMAKLKRIRRIEWEDAWRA